MSQQCSCAGDVRNLYGRVGEIERYIQRVEGRVSRIEEEMGEIANRLVELNMNVCSRLDDLRAGVAGAHQEVHGVHEIAKSSLVGLNVQVREGFTAVQALQDRQTSAMVQLESVRAYTEALALSKKSLAFRQDIDQRFSKAIEGVAMNRMLYDKHFGSIAQEFDAKMRTIGAHIYSIWEEDIRPVEEAAAVPMDAQQALSREVDLSLLAARSEQLESDFDMVRTRHLEPLVALDASLEQRVEQQLAIKTDVPAGTEVLIPAVAILRGSSTEVLIDAEVSGVGEIKSRGRLPAHANFASSVEGQAQVRARSGVRPMTPEEQRSLSEAMQSLAERGLIDADLLPSYRKCMELSQLGFIEGSASQKETADA